MTCCGSSTTCRQSTSGIACEGCSITLRIGKRGAMSRRMDDQSENGKFFAAPTLDQNKWSGPYVIS